MKHEKNLYMKTEKSTEHDVNQDFCWSESYSFMEDDNKLQLLIVTDGVGSCEKAEEASEKAALEFSTAFYKKMKTLYAKNRDKEMFSASYFADQIISVIKEAFHDANKIVCKKDGEYEGSATTLSVVCILKNYAIVANVGDSPVYFYRANQPGAKLKLVSKLQTEAEQGVKAGLYKRYSWEYYKNAGTLLNCLGQYSELDQDKIYCQVVCQLEKGDIFLIGTDGAFGRIREFEIEELLTDYEEDERGYILPQLFNTARHTTNDDQTACLYIVADVN